MWDPKPSLNGLPDAGSNLQYAPPHQWPSPVVNRQGGGLADLVRVGNVGYAGLTAQLPVSPTKLKVLPSLNLRHEVQQLAAASVLVARHAISAVLLHARAQFALVVNSL